jgi:opacity protein-like surface antigen
MRRNPEPAQRVGATMGAGFTLLLAALPLQHARADDLLGLYVGAGVGQSHVQADGSGYSASEFTKNHSAFKAMAGVHPIAPLGAELEYIDMGHPNGGLGGQPANVKMSGEAAFVTLFLPTPVIDVYGKLGAGRLESTLNSQRVQSGTVQPFQLNRTNTRFAAGAGVQYRLGSFGVRAEYERFDAAGANPSLLSLGVTWTLL